MQPEGFLALLNEANVFWAAVCDDEGVPDVARVAGLAPVHRFPHITFFLSEAFAKSVLRTLERRPNLTLLVTSIHSFESYQYKGVCQSIRSCIPEELQQQRGHLDGFISSLHRIGISTAETDKISRLYFQQPSFAVSFIVQQVFTQTPQKGAGRLVLNLEDSHE